MHHHELPALGSGAVEVGPDEDQARVFHASVAQRRFDHVELGEGVGAESVAVGPQDRRGVLEDRLTA